MKSLILSGGGLDTYVAAWAHQHMHPGSQLRLVFFDYGQKAREQEWDATKQICAAMNRREPVGGHLGTLGVTSARKIPLSFFADNIPSPLTSGEIETNPQIGVAHEWVPARNTIFVALALALTEVNDYSRIVTGINKTAAVAYSDNSRGWLDAYRLLIGYATPNEVILDAPLVNLTKSEIVQLGQEMGIPWDVETWSCYAGGKLQCGICSSCRARRDAFRLVGITDLTEYVD